MTNLEMQAEALDRVRTSQALTNYPAIYAGFMAIGIAEADIKPRENVFTFNAWKALGRSVKKGEHGVKVVTFITCAGKVDVDQETGHVLGEFKKRDTYRRPHTTTVFHISQTELTSEREARLANKPRRNGGYRRDGYDRAGNRRGQGYVSVDYSDPGELAADRWNETHGDKPDFGEQLEAIRRGLHNELCSKPVLSAWSSVVDYLTAAMIADETEQFRVLFLNKKNRLIADEVHQRGTVDHVPVYPREVVKRALQHSATAIILAHNHPSGDPTPSRADVQMTELLVQACTPLGIVIHDHLIVGKEGHASLKALKLM